MPQRVLITAGAAGIGREFARAFAATGASVFVCDIDTTAIDAIAKEIPGVIARRYDMARRVDIEHMVPVAVAHLGGLDVLINNAGISGMTLPVADYPPDDWDRVIAVNLTPCSTSRDSRSRISSFQKPASSSTCRRSPAALVLPTAAPTPPPNGA
jgi:NAD(P)-dependent dehydrogenase (short-subunit alcohol dehydrogenase family)